MEFYSSRLYACDGFIFFVKDGWVIALQIVLTLAIAFLVIRQREVIEKSVRGLILLFERPIKILMRFHR